MWKHLNLYLKNYVLIFEFVFNLCICAYVFIIYLSIYNANAIDNKRIQRSSRCYFVKGRDFRFIMSKKTSY